METTSIDAPKMRGPVELLKASWKIISGSFLLFVGFTLLPGLVSLAGIVLPLFSTPLLYTSHAGTNIFLLSFAIWIVAILISSSWSQAALFYTIKNQENKVGFWDILKNSKGKILPILFTYFIYLLVLYTGFGFLVIPGIIFSIWFSFSPFIAATEDVSGVNALLKSKFYVKNHMLGVIGRLLAWGVIVYIFYIGIFIASAILRLSGFAQILAQIMVFLATPFTIVYSYLILEDLREIKKAEEFKPSGFGRFVIIACSVFVPIIVIISILVFIIINPVKQIEKSLDTLDFNLTNTQMVLSEYKSANGKYPENLTLLTPDYMYQVPKDYDTGKIYVYIVSQNGMSFKLCTPDEKTCVTEKTQFPTPYPASTPLP